MEIKLEISFDDEPVSKFCYDLENKKIQLYFNGHYDLIGDLYIDIPCILTIGNWEYAKCRIGDELKLYDLSKHIGVFTLILYMKYNDAKELEMLVITADNRYLTIFFKDPKIFLQ